MKSLFKSRVISREEALLFAGKHNLPYFETSAKVGINVEEVFRDVADRILGNIKSGKINAMKEAF